MDKLLILGTDRTFGCVANYCRSLGVHTITTDFFTAEQSPEKLLTDEYWTIDYSDLDQLEARCRAEGITGIYGGTSEPMLDQVKELTKRLGLPFYASDESWAVSRNKELFKQLCLECGLDTPKRYDIDHMTDEEIAQLRYPVVVKPVDAAASRGLTQCNNEAELRSAYEYALSISKSGHIIVEEHVTGAVCTTFIFAYEGEYYPILTSNADHLIIKNGATQSSYARIPDPLHKPFMDSKYDNIRTLLQKIHFENGLVFIQSLYRDGKFYCIEMGNRLDGICMWRIFERLYGFNLVHFMVDLALGRKLSHETLRRIRHVDNGQNAFASMMYAKHGTIFSIEGMEEIAKDNSYQLLFQRYKVGDTLPEDISMVSVIFHYFVVCETEEEGVEKLTRLYDTLKVLDTDGQELLLKFGGV